MQAPDSAMNSAAIAQLVGAGLFILGSACFVWAAWAEDWVTPFQIGCGIWLAGSMPYLWLPLRSEYLGTDSGGSTAARFAAHLSNMLQVAGMLSWVVGSGFAFHDDLDAGLIFTKAGFLAGSACLLCDAILQARELRSVTRDERSSLLADMLAGVFYMLAGGLEGYAEDLGLMRFGSCCWLVGSLCSGVRPCLALSAGRRARWIHRARKNVELSAEHVKVQVAS